ncbi:competence protein ComEC [Conyzicola nivalis]|uniref:Competence protein ComEC n=1 Tax=Conyzicola nivalis TaxID=1477021 RepID=A0ABV2QMC5_9MICO
MRRGGLDLRLVLPAVVAWVAGGTLTAIPGAAPVITVAVWAVAVVLVGLAVALNRAFVVVAAVCAVAAGIVCASVAARAPARQPEVLLDAARDGRHVMLTVTTAESLGVEQQAVDSAPGARQPPYSATAVSVRVGERVVAVSTPVLVFGARPDARTGIGATLEFGATLEAAAPEDDAAFLVFAAADARTIRGPPWALDWANGLRASFSAASTALPGDGGRLLPGLAIGDTAAVGPQLDAAMKSTSLSHLTAVSGANCAVVIALIMLLGAAAGVPRGVRIVASVLVLVGFVVLVTPQSSVVRAAVMAAIVLFATLAGRPVRGLPVLALAAIALLAVDPWLSRDYGFALSVLATGGLLLLSGPLTRLLARAMPFGVAAVVAVPLAAQLACQPVLVLLDPSLPLYGVVANALAEPAAPLATVIGLLGCLALPAAPWLGETLVAVAWLPASWIAAVATFFASLPAASLPWPEGLLGLLLLAIVTALGLVAVLGGGTQGGDVRGGGVGRVSRRIRLVAAAVALTLLAAFAGATAGAGVAQHLARPADWQIAACDIGQGDAVLVRSGGEIALVDTGPDPELLTRCLDDLGIGRIDLLVLSHFDLDHVGGADAVLGRVDRAVVGPSGGASDDRLVADLVRSGAVVDQVSRGDTGLLGELRYSVLWPRARLGSVEPGNDASVVLAFEPVAECASGCLSSLFLGDLGERSQALMLAAGPISAVDVVKVSHHGSADQSERVYERADATVGVIGVGIDNDYGHPTDRLLDLLDAQGTAVARTDLQGLVLLSPGGTAGEVRVWTQRSPP